ncbi:hypothetical protein [Nostoc sp. LEGE 12450]|nr:hypothetical protein [Nostoc sp. LEGE 12450]
MGHRKRSLLEGMSNTIVSLGNGSSNVCDRRYYYSWLQSAALIA